MIGSRDVIVRLVKDRYYFIYKRSWCTLGEWVAVGPMYKTLAEAEEEAKMFAKYHRYHYRGLKQWWEL